MMPNRSYYRVMAGGKSVYAAECYQQGYIGLWGLEEDLTGKLPDNWREFNKTYVPVYLAANPGKSRVAAGLACGMLHSLCKGINQGDVVLCPTGSGQYYVGEVVSDYYYVPDSALPHRRRVRWHDKGFARDELSEEMKRSTGAAGSVINISRFADEVEALLGGRQLPVLSHSDPTVEDPTVFALEKHLEDFLIANWPTTDLGRDYDIFTVDGELVGQQYPSDTGPIDILAISKDQKTLLVVELKRGRASDAVVGQIQRYMGYVKAELAEPGQQVRGVIIALEDDLRLRRALSVAQGIEFYRYRVSFSLVKAG